MYVEAKVGALLNPDDPESPMVREIVFNNQEDGDSQVIIVRATNGQWFAQVDEMREVAVADTPEQLAEQLWADGQCESWVAAALCQMGWLTLNRKNLKRADKSGWRQPDTISHVKR